MDIEDESYNYWVSRLSSRSPLTVKSYVSHLRQFCKWTSKSPNQLIEERKEELESDDLRIKHRKENELLSYIAYMRDDKKNSGKTQKLAYTAVRSFFGNNHMPLEFMPNDAPKVRSSGRRTITKEELRKVLNVSSLKWKSLILTLRDSGLRLSDVLRLQMKHANNLDGDPPIPIKGILTQKDGSQPITFLGSESVNTLREWVEVRRRGTKILYKGGKGLDSEDISPESYLFTTVNGEEMKVGNASRMVVRQMLKAGLDDVTGHSLRKYFQTQLEAAGVPRNWILRMMGKTLPGSDGSYSMPTQQQLRDSYLQSYSALSTEPETNNERVGALEEEVSRLRAELGKFESVQKILDDPRKWLQAQGDYPPNGLVQDQFWEWMNKRYGDPRIEVYDANITEPETISLEDKIKEIVQNVLTEKNHSTYSYRTIEIDNEKELISLLEEGWEIYREINGKIILRIQK